MIILIPVDHLFSFPIKYLWGATTCICIGYQAATLTGGIYNKRAMARSENIRYQIQTYEMKYAHIMHGIYAYWIIRSKNPLFINGTNMEFN